MNGHSQYVLSLVQRSNTLSAAIIDRSGQVAGLAERVFDDGEVARDELDADALLSGAITLIETVLRRADISAWELSAIGVATADDMVAVWDSVSGAPLAPIRPLSEVALSDGGLTEWLEDWLQQMQRQSDLRPKPGAWRVGGVDSWLVWNLTQGRVHMVASGHRFAAHVQTLSLSPVIALALPKVVDEQGSIGMVNAAYLHGATVPITAVTTVAGSVLFGAAISGPNEAFVSYQHHGFAVFLTANEKDIRVDPLERLTNHPVPLPDFTLYPRMLIGRFGAPQMVLDWLETKGGLRATDLARLQELDKQITLPLFTDRSVLVGSMPQDAGRSAIVGIDSATTLESIYAAALRAMAYHVAELVESVQRATGQRIVRLHTDVCGYALPSLFSFQAAISERPLVVRHGDATALGTALLAGLAAGVWETGQVLDWLDSAGAAEVYEAHDLDPLLRAERRLWRQLSSGVVP